MAICFASKAGAVQYAVYVLGNLFSVLSLLMVKKMGKDKIRSGVFFSFLYATVVVIFFFFVVVCVFVVEGFAVVSFVVVSATVVEVVACVVVAVTAVLCSSCVLFEHALKQKHIAADSNNAHIFLFKIG